MEATGVLMVFCGYAWVGTRRLSCIERICIAGDMEMGSSSLILCQVVP